MGAPAWRLLCDGPADAAWNMSLDEALLCGVSGSAPVLRFYRWRCPSVSLGYRQSAPHWPPDAPAVELVRRATGGGAVLHADDLTYAVIAPRDCPDLPPGLAASSCRIREILIEGLADAGIEALPSRGAADAVRAELCFSATTGSEIESSGAKLVGSAQRRTRWGLLQHGSLRVRDDTALYERLFGSNPGPAAHAGCSHEALERALAAAFGRALDGRLEPSALRDGERRLALERQQSRARDPLVVPPLSSRSPVFSADRLP